MNRLAARVCCFIVAAALVGCVPYVPPVGTLTDYSGRQIYWDKVVAPDLPPDSADCAAVRTEVATRYGHPPLMAIGDSLYNGVQSMRINWWLSEWSAPTLVALRLDLIDERAADRQGPRTFYGPQYPLSGATAAETSARGNYGFNLETVTLDAMLTLPQDEASSLDALANRAAPPNHRPVVDNIAFSGAQTGDLLDWNGNDHVARVAELLPHLRGSLPGAGFSTLADTFFHSNAAFVLNPMHDRCIGEMSPIEQVALRVPRRVLVNIGANDGLWQIAFYGDPINFPTCSDAAANLTRSGKPECEATTLADAAGREFLAHMERILDRLAGVAGIERVYVNGLPLPSETANLVPDGARSRWNADLFSGQFERPGLTAAQMAAADALIASSNAQLQKMVEQHDAAARPGMPRFAFVDLAATLEKLDYKDCVSRKQADCTGKELIVDRAHFMLPFDQPLTNQPLRFNGPSGPETGPDMRPRIKQGGLMSFDNMHLSSVGYEVMAQAVIDRMLQLEPDVPAVTVAQCTAPGDPASTTLKNGDCIAFMTRPGWSYADATRRNFVFDRTGGLRETQDRRMFSAIAGFALGLTRNSQ